MGYRSWAFDLRYLLGRPLWDTEVTSPEVVELIEGRGLPPGRALDLGCGTGTNCIYLARHGWEGVAPEKVRSLFVPAFAVEREEGGEDPSGPRSAWYWLRKLCLAPA